jgi:hypothetical protein
MFDCPRSCQTLLTMNTQPAIYLTAPVEMLKLRLNMPKALEPLLS